MFATLNSLTPLTDSCTTCVPSFDKRYAVVAVWLELSYLDLLGVLGEKELISVISCFLPCYAIGAYFYIFTNHIETVSANMNLCI